MLFFAVGRKKFTPNKQPPRFRPAALTTNQAKYRETLVMAPEFTASSQSGGQPEKELNPRKSAQMKITYLGHR
jgi:hypothetical protein